LSSKKLILSRLEDYLSIHDIPLDAHFLVAFSGGCDSLCLLSSLSSLYKGQVTACYVDHRLRGEEELSAERALNAANCKKLNVPFLVVKLGDGEVADLARAEDISIEAAARALRYRELEKARARSNSMYIVTAHTASDQAETVLMRLYTGSTFQALSGISPKSEKVLRPLITVKRQDTEGYCRELGLEFSTDSTNGDDTILRNHVRASLLPNVKNLCPNVESRLENIARNVKELIKKEEVLPVYHTGPYSYLDIRDFRKLSVVGKSRTLISLAAPYFKGRVSSAVLAEIAKLMEKGAGRLEYDLCYVRMRDDIIVLYPKLHHFVKPVGSLPEKLTGNFEFVKGTKATDLSIDPSLVTGKLIFRLAEEGDIVKLSDKLTLVSDLLTDMKVPYAFVAEDQAGIVAIFASVFGGRDRLAKRFLSIAPNPENLYSVIYRNN
jgi:tRNA(Ile)-lysidine synthetase, N-terminal domain